MAPGTSLSLLSLFSTHLEMTGQVGWAPRVTGDTTGLSSLSAGLGEVTGRKGTTCFKHLWFQLFVQPLLFHGKAHVTLSQPPHASSCWLP